jgi:hypothetical protein
VTEHHVTVDRGTLGKQWRCTACPWTSPLVLWDAPRAAHAQAARAAVDHERAKDNSHGGLQGP